MHIAFPRLRFPLLFVRLLNWVPVFSLDLFGVLGSLGCIFDSWGFHEDLLFTTLWPLGATAALVALGRLCAAARGDAGRAVLERCAHVALFITFVVFPSASTTVFDEF